MSADGRRDGSDNPPAAGPVSRGEGAYGTARPEKQLAYAPVMPPQATGDGEGGNAKGDGDGALAKAGGRRPYLQQVIHDTGQPLTARAGLTWICILLFFACFAPFVANSHPILITGDQWSSPMFRSLGPVDIALPVGFITALILLVRRRLSIGPGLALVLWTTAVTFDFAVWHSVPDYYRALRGGGRQDLLSAPLAWSLIGLMFAITASIIFLIPLLVLPRRTTLGAGIALLPLLALMQIFPVKPAENVVYERYREMEAAGQQGIIRTIVPYSATDRLRDRQENRLQPPNRVHWLGTDNYGADLLSRMIHASRIALAIGFIATGIAVVIGVFVGALMGYFAGTIDLFGMRVIEILEAIPRLVLLIAIAASWGRNLYLMMAVIGLLSWTGDARFIRAEFLKLRKQDFVQAAIATGLPLRSILFRHMLPNGISPVLVSASFGVASAILLESTLSFLGLGLVDEPSWGEMLNQARSGGTGFNWWIATFPGMAIFLTVFSYNLVGESVRDALDPKLLKRD